ncbi:hypothetical protein BCR33DRAFT_711091 [Rhizoclosmatium globosum]|uniref:KRAB-related domain-containing protein n=1 Tax=Rhizoclosmatium globosum TaxID=329046 RepID=A0A1Y2D361_9FUNG|nr:hypothetical protein BCR33DRAFT_711091 [Rhizoclosmatium globosum]|eukprot:ORY53733.1 hypothetical protein BCR33DRAFT_711091 [Rhizoclosmatium globosum]
MDGLGEESIIKNKLAFQLLKAAVETSQSEPICSQALDIFLTELSVYSTSVLTKQKQIQLMNTRQQSHFLSDLETVVSEIEETRADIEKLKQELEWEGLRRAEKLEYDAIARKNMATLQLEIASLEAEQQRLNQAFDFRKTLLHNVGGGKAGKKRVDDDEGEEGEAEGRDEHGDGRRGANGAEETAGDEEEEGACDEMDVS